MDDCSNIVKGILECYVGNISFGNGDSVGPHCPQMIAVIMTWVYVSSLIKQRWRLLDFIRQTFRLKVFELLQ